MLFLRISSSITMHYHYCIKIYFINKIITIKEEKRRKGVKKHNNNTNKKVIKNNILIRFILAVATVVKKGERENVFLLFYIRG